MVKCSDAVRKVLPKPLISFEVSGFLFFCCVVGAAYVRPAGWRERPEHTADIWNAKQAFTYDALKKEDVD